MFLILDLQNPANWLPKWDFDIEAQRPSSNAHIPIGEVSCPLICHSPVLGVYCEAPNRRPSWTFGGGLRQKIRTGLTVGGGLNVDTDTYRRIYVDRLQIVTFNNIQVADYELSFKPPFWHDRVKLTVFEYVGEISTDTRESIKGTNQLLLTGFTSTSTKLQQIDLKIDSLL